MSASRENHNEPARMIRAKLLYPVSWDANDRIECRIVTTLSTTLQACLSPPTLARNVAH